MKEYGPNKKIHSPTTVKINDGFFRNYQKQMICKVVPTAIKNVEDDEGGMENIKNAALKLRGSDHGGFRGMFYVDSDVHKVLESMCYALSIDPFGDDEIISAQADIKEKLEEWIPYFVDGAEPSGYFDSYYTLNEYPKFSDVQMHELYCMGHFIEAAIAHYKYSPFDTRLINTAIACADFLCRTFGEGQGKLRQISGHQEIEIALLKLADTVADMEGMQGKRQEYVDLAAFFLELRGDHKNRTLEGTFPEKYWQDHQMVKDQKEAVGHAVRAQYMYSAMAELSRIDGGYRDRYREALWELWNDVTLTKQYVTGGIGQSHSNEGFHDPYYLPNASAYCETCAGIANMMWNKAMSKLYHSSEFADIIETALYNAVLGCVNLDGDKFFYVNALESRSGAMRSAWYGTACCPPNLTRTMLSLGGYIYNIPHGALIVDQYISNDTSLEINDTPLKISMKSGLPWLNAVSLCLDPKDPITFRLYLRLPHWSSAVKLSLNGEPLELCPDGCGYSVIERKWSSGDRIDVEFSMPVKFERTSDKVTNNQGCASLRRGPIVYCAESADNCFDMALARIDTTSSPKLIYTSSIDSKPDPYKLRGMYLIELDGYLESYNGTQSPVKWTFIPFFARSNRALGHMRVYVSEIPRKRPLSAFAKPSASFTCRYDSVFNINDGECDPDSRWTSWRSGELLLDPWVQYDFDMDVTLRGCRILWYDDGGGVRLPDSIEIYYKSSESEDLIPVTHESEYRLFTKDDFTVYEFKAVTLNSLRIVISNSKAAAGIVCLELIEADK